MNKSSKKVKDWRARTKYRLILYKGGKCEKCGYDKIQYHRAFEFHHLDPKEKDFGLGYKGRCIALEELKKEADKCILLCSRCHREIHDEPYLENRDVVLQPVILSGGAKLQSRPKTCFTINCESCGKSFKQKRKEQIYCSRECSAVSQKHEESDKQSTKKQQLEKIVCPVCQKEFIRRRERAIFCSSECSHKNRRVKNRPTSEELKVLIDTKPMTHIGKMFNVSDNAVRKWAKQYGLL